MTAYDVDIAPLGALEDPRPSTRLAIAAEGSGRDGLSIWDSLGLSTGGGGADPFVALAAVAVRTERLKLITVDVGATWWLESLSPRRGSLDELERIVLDRPPR